MKYKYYFLSLLIITVAISKNCSSMKNMDEILFAVKDAYYQSWIVSENEKGTNIVIEITNKNKGVVFDSIIFRNKKLPIFSTEKEGVLYLKSILTVEQSRILLNSEPADEPDKILYYYHGTRRSYDLKDLRRLEMKYY
jgi:hypothetical protein